MTKIKAGGGLIYRISKKGHIKILLIKRKGFWDLPKGKLEKGESMPECAAREIMEEIGLKRYPMVIRPLINTLHNYKEKSKTYQKTTYWYLMYTAERLYTPQAEEKIQAVKWVKIDKAFNKVRFDNLRQVIDAFRKIYSKEVEI